MAPEKCAQIKWPRQVDAVDEVAPPRWTLSIRGPAEQSELRRQPEDSQLDDAVGGAPQAHGRRQPPSCDMDLVGRVKLTWLI